MSVVACWEDSVLMSDVVVASWEDSVLMSVAAVVCRNGRGDGEGVPLCESEPQATQSPRPQGGMLQ